MMFGTLVRSLTDVMKVLNDQKVPFDDVLLYCNYGGKLYPCNKIELRYSPDIDKHAFIISFDK